MYYIIIFQFDCARIISNYIINKFATKFRGTLISRNFLHIENDCRN